MTTEEGKMQNHTVRFSNSTRHHDQNQRGIALITTLLLLLLMTGLSLAMVIAARSDMMINGYYRNFRGSFYAADSGLNIARQDRSEEHTSELQSPCNIVCRLLLEKKKNTISYHIKPYTTNTLNPQLVH